MRRTVSIAAGRFTDWFLESLLLTKFAAFQSSPTINDRYSVSSQGPAWLLYVAT